MTPAIVLAAGLSSRYAGGNKLLADFNGWPLLVHVVARLRPAARPIIVVTGHKANRVRACLRRTFGPTARIRVVHNRRYRGGMASSLQTGIRALPAGASKAFLCLGDMPGVDARLLRRLNQSWQQDVDVVRPVCHGKPGHPVLISRRLFGAFETLSGDRGAQSILATLPAARQKRVPWHAGCIIDTDTPAALRRARLRLARIRASFDDINTINRASRWR